MHLKILLPFRVFSDEDQVSSIVAEAQGGSFGILANRLDCAAALVPGILSYQSPGAGEVFLAVDEGVLVKAGAEVQISVRNAIRGSNLAQLRSAVSQQFLAVNEEEQKVKDVMAKLESGFIRRLGEYQRE